MGQRTSATLILIVEDDWVIASQIEALLLDAGYKVVGPTGHLADAIEMALKEPITAALLDIELTRGDLVYPVAEALMGREIPFAFISSRPQLEIDPVYRGLPCVGKPFAPEALLSALRNLVSDDDRSA